VLQVRAVDFDADKPQLLEILQRNLPDLPHAQRFDWIYRRNAAGPAWAWFVVDSASKKAVAAASVFSRAIWIDNTVKLCGQVGDFAVDAPYRSLGPALILQKATFQPVDEGQLVFCYDCPPHDRGMSTFRRLGMEPNTEIHRYTRLLRLEKWLGKKSGSSAVAAIGGAAANPLLRVASSGPRSKAADGKYELNYFEDRFGEEFSLLDKQVPSTDTIRSRRGAENLNWRYRDDPLHQYQVITARRNGALEAFIILLKSDDEVYVVDLFGSDLDKSGPALIDAAAYHQRKQKIQAFHAFSPPGTPMSATLEKAGFRQREASARVVAYTKPGSETNLLLRRDTLKWSFTRADLMV